MTIGIVGRKTGMTRVFTADGTSIPVTVVEATPNRVTQVKTADIDGYSAVQITVGERKASRSASPKPDTSPRPASPPGAACGSFVSPMAWTLPRSAKRSPSHPSKRARRST
jgi:large subunit ribosomal protein L3